MLVTRNRSGGMRILGRYIGREFSVYFLSCLLSLLIIFITFMALGELELLERDEGIRLFFSKVLSGVPILIETVAPISVLLATVLTFINLSKTSEVTAMLAAGVSLFQLVMPILLISFLIGAFGYFNQSYLAPWLGSDKQLALVDSEKNRDVWRFYKGRLFFLSGLTPGEKSIERGKVYSFDSKFGIEGIETLRSLRLKNDEWSISRTVTIRPEQRQLTKKEEQNVKIPEDSFPVAFQAELLNPKYSTFNAIFQQIRIKKMGGVSYDATLFALYQKIAAILSIFVMVILALPFSLSSGRSANVRLGIVFSIVLGFLFWLIDQIFISLYDAGILGGEFAAFGGNITFFLIALLLIILKKN